MLTAEILRKLASLNLSPEQMSGVLDILADGIEKEEKRRKAQTERKRMSRDRHVTVTGMSRDGHSDKGFPPDSPPDGFPCTPSLTPPLTPPSQTDILTLPNGSSSMSCVPQQKKQRQPKSDDPYTEEFEVFWRLFPPNNGNKRPAFEKYNSMIKKGISHETIVRGAENYRRFIESDGKGPQYTQHAATWLNQRGWETDYLAIVAGPARGFPVTGDTPADKFLRAARRVIAEDDHAWKADMG